ncbi:MAG: FtsX-like permease family protein [Firmicutes bacterium]|nr:FtsX-like permease family protein [Bacillota bacterium]
MALVAIILSIIFMAVASIITFNATLISIYSDKKTFGIYKAFGMTPLQIRLSMVWKVALLAAVGVSIGMPLALATTPGMLGVLLTNMGLVSFPFDITLWGTLAVIPVCLAVALLSAWLPSGRILGLNPRNLIIE